MNVSKELAKALAMYRKRCGKDPEVILMSPNTFRKLKSEAEEVVGKISGSPHFEGIPVDVDYRFVETDTPQYGLGELEDE